MKYFLDKKVTFKRLRVKTGNRTAYSATGTSLYSSWQNPALETIQMYEGQIGKLYQVFLDGEVGYDRSDQVVRDGVTYQIRDIKVVDFGSQHFTKLIVVES